MMIFNSKEPKNKILNCFWHKRYYKMNTQIIETFTHKI